MSQTDPGLDERVARKLGWEFPSQYESSPWPPISTSWEWAGKALEELSKQQKWCRVSGPHFDGLWEAAVYGRHDSIARFAVQAPTGPLAIARAIDKAMPEPKL